MPATSSVISAPAPPSVSSYSAPASPSVASDQPLEILTQYGAGATNTWSQGDPVIQDTASSYNAPAPAAAPAVTYGNSAAQISDAVSAYSSPEDSNSFNTVSSGASFDSISEAGGQSFEPSSYAVSDSASRFPASPSVSGSAPDSYGEPAYPSLAPQPPVLAAAPAPDNYGEPQSPPVQPSYQGPVSITTARSFTVDYDDYDPFDVPADQAKVI